MKINVKKLTELNILKGITFKSAYVFLLLIWVIFQPAFEIKLLGLLIIAFFLVPEFFRLLRYFVLLLTVLISVLLNTNTLAFGAYLIQAQQNSQQNINQQLIEIVSPNSGLAEVLPKEDWLMLSLIKVNQLPDFRFEDQAHQDSLIGQRLIEIAWPVKLAAGSNYLLSDDPDINSTSNCRMMDQREEVFLEYCP